MLSSQRKKEGFQGQKAVVIPRMILSKNCERQPFISTLYITDIGYYPKAKYHYRTRPAGADQHILIYCYDGRGTVQIEKTEYDIEAGDYFIVPMKTAHTYTANENAPWTIYWMHFKGSASSSIVANFVNKEGNHRGFIKNSEVVVKLFSEIYTQLERGYGSDNLNYANMCFWHYLASFIYNSKNGFINNREARDAADTAIDYLTKNIDQTLTLEAIAGTANLSPAHFSFVFKKKTGFSPIEYFNHLKVQKACQYLLFTEHRIKEIALELGMKDQYYFSRMFSKIMGISPNDYRRKRIH